MAKKQKPTELAELEKELTRLAKEGSMKELAEALLRHPVHGTLLRAFAAEENAPEHDKFMQLIIAEYASKEVGDG